MGNISQINGLNITAETASYALFAATVSGSVTNAVSASYASVAQTLLGSVVSASYATTASYASTAQTLLGSVVSASYAATASLAPNYVLNSATSSFVTNAQTSSFVLNSQTSSFVTTTQTSSFVQNSQTSSMSVATASNITPAISNDSDTRITTANGNGTLNAESLLTFDGTKLSILYQAGDEGGEILLNKSVTNNSLTGSGITVDSFQNRIRFFEQGGTARGAYIDLTACAGGVGTNILAGGGASPGGNANELQYNNGAGGFAGAANLEVASGNLNFMATTDPSAPASGVVTMYSKTIAGKTFPKVIDPLNLSYPLQSALWQNPQYIWTTTGATNGLWLNTVGAGAGTFTSAVPTLSGGSAYTIQKRSRYANVATTANQVLGQRNTDLLFFRGAAAGQGGFFFYTRCGFDVWTNGGRFFAGMAPSSGVASADPSSITNCVGFAVDAADNGAISFLTRGASATKASTGFTIVTGKGYDCFIYNPPNSGTFYWRIVDLVAGTEASGTATLTPPAASTGLTANVLASNAALTTVTSIQLGIAKIYIETDY